MPLVRMTTNPVTHNAAPETTMTERMHITANIDVASEGMPANIIYQTVCHVDKRQLSAR